MTPTEIKNVFGVDITQKDRKYITFAFKCFYIEENLHNFKDYNEICDSIGMHRTSIYNNRKKFQRYLDTDPIFEELYKDFKNRNPLAVVKAQRTINNKYQYKERLYLRMIQSSKRKYKTYPMLEVIDVLRHYPDNSLWDRVLREWGEQHWANFEMMKEKVKNKPNIEIGWNYKSLINSQ